MNSYLHHASVITESGLQKQVLCCAVPVAQPGGALPQMPHVPVQKTFKFLERQTVDLALEVDHRIHRHPVLVPAPGVEFRVAAGAQRDIAIASGQAQQKPDLLLAAIEATVVAPRQDFS